MLCNDFPKTDLTAGFENRISPYCCLQWQFEPHHSLKAALGKCLYVWEQVPGSWCLPIVCSSPYQPRVNASFITVCLSPRVVAFPLSSFSISRVNSLSCQSPDIHVLILVMCAFVYLCLSLATKKPTDMSKSQIIPIVMSWSKTKFGHLSHRLLLFLVSAFCTLLSRALFTTFTSL